MRRPSPFTLAGRPELLFEPQMLTRASGGVDYAGDYIDEGYQRDPDVFDDVTGEMIPLSELQRRQAERKANQDAKMAWVGRGQEMPTDMGATAPLSSPTPPPTIRSDLFEPQPVRPAIFDTRPVEEIRQQAQAETAKDTAQSPVSGLLGAYNALQERSEIPYVTDFVRNDLPGAVKRVLDAQSVGSGGYTGGKMSDTTPVANALTSLAPATGVDFALEALPFAGEARKGARVASRIFAPADEALTGAKLGAGVPLFGDELERMERSAKLLAAARKEGPEAYAAELARQQGIERARNEGIQEATKANTSLRWGNTAKQELATTAEQMKSATTKAREFIDNVLSDETGSITLPGSPQRYGPASSQPLTQRDLDGITNFIDTRKQMMANLKPDAGFLRRNVGAKLSGDQPSPWLSELLNGEKELGDVMGRAIKGASPVEQEVLTEFYRKGFREEMLKTLEPNARKAAETTLNAIDTERRAGGMASSAYDTVNNALRSAVLGVDVTGVGLQQGLRAARGSPAIGTGLVGRVLRMAGADPIYKPGIDRILQAQADGLLMGRGGATAGVKNIAGSGGGKLREAARLPGKVLDAASALQFEHALGSVRLKAYEGLLLQNWALDKLTRGVLGGDITNPAVRRHIAEFANTLGSSARTATAPRRAAIEGRTMLSAQMTRAQVNEIATLIKSPRSHEDALNTLNLLAGTALLFAGAKELNDQVGVGNLVTDTADSMFGKMTLASKNSKGAHQVVDFLPQASLARTLFKSYDALGQGDVQRLGEVWAQFGAGRLSIPASDALRAGGFGYGEGGQFHTAGDMPLGERATGSLPLPLWARGAALEGERDPTSLGLSALGANTYGESAFAQKERLAQQMFGMSIRDLLPDEQVQLNLRAMEMGETIDSAARYEPVKYAASGALKYAQQRLENDAAFADKSSAFLDDLGMQFNIRQYTSIAKAEDDFIDTAMKAGATRTQADGAWEDYRNKVLGIERVTRSMREDAIKADPGIVDAWDELYEKGVEENGVPNWARELVK